MNWAENGELSGTYGRAKRLEAIQIELTGEMKNHYDIYYRVHAQSFGWLGWAKNGESSGTEAFRGNTNFACSKRWKCPFQ